MIENEMSVAVPALAAGAVAFVFIAFLYTKLAKFETGSLALTLACLCSTSSLCRWAHPPRTTAHTHARARA